MIATMMQLYCDGDHGIEIHFPNLGAVDGAICSASDLRREARKRGWRRRHGQDLCPSCARTEQVDE